MKEEGKTFAKIVLVIFIFAIILNNCAGEQPSSHSGWFPDSSTESVEP